MAINLTIESPDFNRIRRGDAHATEDAIRLLWFVANEEARLRRSTDRQVADRLSPKVLSLAPSADQDNVDTQGAGFIAYTGASAVNVTGYRAPSFAVDVLFLLVTGAGTITHQHQNASSDAGNRMVFQSAGDLGVATNQAIMLTYYDSRWREMKWAA